MNVLHVRREVTLVESDLTVLGGQFEEGGTGAVPGGKEQSVI